MSKAGKGQQQPKVFLNVTYAEKDVVKALGARFDGLTKAWFIPPNLIKDVSKFAKWVVAPTPAAKGKMPSVTPGPGTASASGMSGDGKKRPFALITPGAVASEEEAEPAPIPSYMHYKLQQLSTAELAKILVGLGVKLEIGLDRDELIELLQAHPDKVHIDMAPPPPVVFKAPKQLTEHELILARLKQEARAKALAELKAKEIVPEITRSSGAKSAAPKKAKGEAKLDTPEVEKQALVVEVEVDPFADPSVD